MQRSYTMGKKDINRLKVILVEQKHTAKGLTEQVRLYPATVLKWYTNTLQSFLVHYVKWLANWRTRSSLFFKTTRLHRKILAYSRLQNLISHSYPWGL
jgi:hypothetical protein